MDFETWSPLYDTIMAEFGYDREADEGSARCLEVMVPSERLCGPLCIRRRIRPKVTVCAPGPSLPDKLDQIDPQSTIVAAGPATSILFDHGIVPHILVTDLDGMVEADIKCNAIGTLAVIHAHGDNLERVLELVPRFVGPITPTTQSVPDPRIFNFGGFTDGDRAVCLVRQFGARYVNMVGFDFDHPSVKAGQDPNIKILKLQWAKKIIFEHNPKGVELSMV